MMERWKVTEDVALCPMAGDKQCATCRWYRTWVNSPIKEGEPGRCSHPEAIGRGSVVQLGRHSYTVDKVLGAEDWGRDGYRVEFIDNRGRYHHWKQYEDGGSITP